MAAYQADTLSERPIYGSSRLGNLSYASKPGYRTVGHKQYELSNHLGNVLAVVSDRIRMKTDSTWTQVLSRTDGSCPDERSDIGNPFGLEMTGRTESATYRYGFNGKEKDPSGQWSNQTHYDYGFRIYNPTIGKFLSVDPLAKEFPWYTPYQFAGNKPIKFIDIDGLEEGVNIRHRMMEEGYLKGTVSEKELKEYYKSTALGAAMGLGAMVDVFVTKGWISRSLADLSFGDLVHSTQMQTHYRDLKMPSRADQFKEEGGQAVTELAVEGLSYGAVKWASQLVKRAPKIPYLDGVDDLVKTVPRSIDDVNSLRGATWEEAENLIPNDWIKGQMKKGDGVKFTNPNKNGEMILLEKGWPGAKDPLHSGPYMRISRDGQVTRVPLEGNPTLK